MQAIPEFFVFFCQVGGEAEKALSDSFPPVVFGGLGCSVVEACPDVTWHLLIFPDLVCPLVFLPPPSVEIRHKSSCA